MPPIDNAWMKTFVTLTRRPSSQSLLIYYISSMDVWSSSFHQRNPTPIRPTLSALLTNAMHSVILYCRFYQISSIGLTTFPFWLLEWGNNANLFWHHSYLLFCKQRWHIQLITKLLLHPMKTKAYIYIFFRCKSFDSFPSLFKIKLKFCRFI